MSIVVLSDSLAFFGPKGGLPANDPNIWPSIVAEQCGRDLRLFGRIGWTSRDVWWALTQDPNIWAAIPDAEVVVLAFGGMDSLPSPL
ncbi:MAG: SGNH/GDSL hydrolase family protein, partial [Gordonia sp.]|nr:SGNH/GDSL hydrolase family protein [Gordonia sp. (in: high G+C Gram-positive bacteria)]